MGVVQVEKVNDQMGQSRCVWRDEIIILSGRPWGWRIEEADEHVLWLAMTAVEAKKWCGVQVIGHSIDVYMAGVLFKCELVGCGLLLTRALELSEYLVSLEQVVDHLYVWFDATNEIRSLFGRNKEKKTQWKSISLFLSANYRSSLCLCVYLCVCLRVYLFVCLSLGMFQSFSVPVCLSAYVSLTVLLSFSMSTPSCVRNLLPMLMKVSLRRFSDSDPWKICLTSGFLLSVTRTANDECNASLFFSMNWT